MKANHLVGQQPDLFARDVDAVASGAVGADLESRHKRAAYIRLYLAPPVSGKKLKQRRSRAESRLDPADLAEAQFTLGLKHARGEEDVPRDQAAAVDWFRQAALGGHAQAAYSLGVIHTDGSGVPPDLVEAFRWFELAARQDHVEAQFRLANMYHFGQGVAASLVDAVRWYRAAAEKDHAEAQSYLAFLHYRGLGVVQDRVAAINWWRQAAEQGHPEAWFCLGCVHTEGEPGQAVGYFRLATEAGSVDAENNLGVMYGAGQGVPSDKQASLRWFTRAAEQGNVTAQFNLGLLYLQGGGAGSHNKTLKWWRLAAEAGQMHAEVNLGLLYLEGTLLPQNYRRAAEYLASAAGKGDARAQFALGSMYLNGKGIPGDYREAYILLSLAAEGDERNPEINVYRNKAKRKLKVSELPGVTRDFARRRLAIRFRQFNGRHLLNIRLPEPRNLLEQRRPGAADE